MISVSLILKSITFVFAPLSEGRFFLGPWRYLVYIDARFMDMEVSILARQWVLGLGIAILFPLSVFLLLNVLEPVPRWENYQIADYAERYKAARENSEREALVAERRTLNSEFARDQERWARRHSGLVTGVLVITLLGAATLANRVAAAGLMGGMLVLFFAVLVRHWAELTVLFKLALVAPALAALLIAVYGNLDNFFNTADK